VDNVFITVAYQYGDAPDKKFIQENLDYTALNSLAGYFPVSFGKFTVESFNPDDDGEG
jgi:hypothetical protein